MPIKHLFTSGVSDGADATLVRPSNWNANHDGFWTNTVNADIVKSDTALADVTGLTFAVGVGTFILEAVIMSLAAAATTGMTLAVNGPTLTYMQAAAEFYTTASAKATVAVTAYNTAMTSTAQLLTVTPQYLYAYIVVSAAGTIAVRWSPEVAASATVKRGSFATLFQVA